FGIDRRDVVESMWWFVDQGSGPSAVKIIEENRAGVFRKDILRLTCRSASTLRLQYGRDLGANGESWPATLRLTANAGSFMLGSPAKAPQSDSRAPREVRSVDLPLSVLGDAAFTIEPVEAVAALTKSRMPSGSKPEGDLTAAATPGAAASV